MSSKMLIDASHPEETRVVVTTGNKIEDFDFESEHKKQIRGNIYLAKITRVEPSLQAAFVEYGGNRHGFLPFSEIHPDYYQIPVADREALLREYARDLEEADDDVEAVAPEEGEEEDTEERKKPKRRSRRGGRSRKAKAETRDESEAEDEPEDRPDETSDENSIDEGEDDSTPDSMAAMVETDSVSEEPEGNREDDTAEEAPKKPRRRSTRRKAPVKAETETAETEAVTATETADEVETVAKPKRRTSHRKKAEPVAKADESDDVQAGQAADPTEQAAVNSSADDASADDKTTESPSKPKRRTSRRKKAPVAEASEPNEETADDLALNEAEGGASDAVDRAPDTDDGDDPAEDVAPEETGAADALEEVASRKQRAPRKHYKIQEVVKRRQIMLVQVTKEERGNKGAALTTYLSLAGRYSVLMPNTARGGGISRKIAQASDRKRLKEIARELDVPQGMGVILRTAAAARTKQEVNRDFDYLMRLWDSVRELTLSSSAPALVYEEGDLIKRSIRDLYRKEIGEIIVSGEEGYREAKDFMKMLMPSQARVVKRWTKPTPLLAAQGVEAELDRMMQPNVTLKSGGYLIINQTEALVAIDVNSGRATREHSIEATALQTNLEAAEEVARQLRLRDLAGLIVIDFIDMDEKRNNRAVEKKLKDCLKDDRARIQLGRISSFGLLEMSRQRMRSSMLESTMQVCEHCQGTGHVRSPSSISMQVLRAIEEQMRKTPGHAIVVRTDSATALHILNHKRGHIADLEAQHGSHVVIEADERIGNQNFQVERGDAIERAARAAPQVRQDATLMEDEDEADTATTENALAETQSNEAQADDEAGDERDGRKRRRRGRRGGRNRRNEEGGETSSEGAEAQGGTNTDQDDALHASDSDEPSDAVNEDRSHKMRRRSSRRTSEDVGDVSEPASAEQAETGEDASATNAEEGDTRKPRRSTRRRKAPVASASEDDSSNNASGEASTDNVGQSNEAATDDAVTDDAVPSEEPQRARRSTRRRKAPIATSAEKENSEASEDTASLSVQPNGVEPSEVKASDDANGESAKRATRSTRRRKAPVVTSGSSEETNVIDTIAAANGSDDVSEPTRSDASEPQEDDDASKKWWRRGFF